MKKTVWLYIFLGVFGFSLCIPYIQAKMLETAIDIELTEEREEGSSKKEVKSFQIIEEYLHEEILVFVPSKINSNCHNRSQIGNCSYSASEIYSPPEA